MGTAVLHQFNASRRTNRIICCFFSCNKFFHKAYFLQSVKFVIVFIQNHMNTLAAETASAWYLILNRKLQTLPIYITQLSSHLPRPLTMGTQQVSAGAAVITPQHRSYRVPQGSPQVFGGP
jgi:hypothetical protein